MGAHLIDSRIFGHQWTTPESRALFDEPARVARWLEIVITLAEAQAECGVIPAESALAIGQLRGAVLPIEEIARRTRETSHSTLGMIQVLRERLAGAAAEHVYYGTTVQDVTDTAQALEIRATCSLLWRDWRQIESDMLALALQHRATPMPGRTHGQPGAPIAFGFKVATWADELGRHLQRLRQGGERWMVGQLGGAVGTLAFFGERALPLRSAFCRRLGLRAPAVSWLSSRDCLAEFAHVVAMAVSSLARLANEVYALQRREIGELAEKTRSSTVGSITMPHKRNPEVSEQIVVLARLVRSHAAVLTDTMVQEHERDARGWKAEWVVLPELCHMALAATTMARELMAGLEVRTDAMRRNLDDNASSEHLLSVMALRLGKHRAQAVLNDAYRRARDEQLPLEQVLQGVASAQELAELPVIDLGASAAMVDAVVAATQRRRDAEPAEWA
ncbi:MAG: adenylosuccinate lyase family protein [Piscinibacter sp.]|uniref:class-II fumarase/aspartase family protein n=1 Tax=Piscinibacter sp. TaxID=1903157 RepID=UPI0025901FA9|nr:adenylosuccinate lyase family protein [Piscinibacter sp.]MCW5662860.1 adenylosuccinate lyase family protein [Piscinibacter sp.]